MSDTTDQLPALEPHGAGAQFVFYGDSCSGIAGALHETKLRQINDVVRRLSPAPEFLLYPGDEIIGLTADEGALRAQWRHWFEREMAWLDLSATPMLNCTANHTVYDLMSDRIYAEVMAHLPDNGPANALRRNYVWRQGDLAVVVVDTNDQRLGGEGHVDLDWLAEGLGKVADARWICVMGHHPIWPVNGYVGAYQRTIGLEYGREFWRLLTENNVIAYLCSHILAFDAQCHEGVLQICSAGAGTAHRMPEEIEYLHCVQMAIDAAGLRYQTFDETGAVRETLSWPPPEPQMSAPLWLTPAKPLPDLQGKIITLAISGQATADGLGQRQTLLAGIDQETGDMPFWAGLAGRDQRLVVALQPTPGRSPHQWLGPAMAPDAPFSFQLMLHPGLGPGGVLWRPTAAAGWSTLEGASAWGPERLQWPDSLVVGRDGRDETKFRGADLDIRLAVAPQPSIWSPS